MILKDELMIDVLRSGALESQHIGSVAVVDFDGHVLAHLGNTNRRSFMRSSIKPVQAIPLFMDTDCMKHFKFTATERAYMMSSHNAERRHQEVGAKILEKIGLKMSSFKCGIHPPAYKKTAHEMTRNHEDFNPLCNNCSGNHLAMLALTVYRGWDLKSYIDPNHPYQQEVLKWISILSDIPGSLIKIGIDNCSVPAYNLTLSEMAKIYARLSLPEKIKDIPNTYNMDYDKAILVMRQISRDFWSQPYMVGGTNRLCTYLNKIGKSKFWSKAGAEGMQLIAYENDGIGIAVKITDGDPLDRAKQTATIETLRQLGLIDDADIKKAGKLYCPELPNLMGLEGQKIIPRFKLIKSNAWRSRFP